jgi:hypothetical protein
VADNMKPIISVVSRKEGIGQSSPARYTVVRRAAESLSRRNVDAAVCELLNEALARLVQLVYEQDAAGLCNVDAATGKLLIPAPWGRLGHAKWGLRPIEGIILREIMFGLSLRKDKRALFHYDRSRRTWFVDLYNYANVHLAHQWLTQHQIDVQMYRAARDKRMG